MVVLVGTDLVAGNLGLMNMPKCDQCAELYPGFCRRCAYLMNNMRRWRRVAEQLHAQHCTHQKRQQPSSCNVVLQDMYESIDMSEIGEL